MSSRASLWWGAALLLTGCPADRSLDPVPDPDPEESPLAVTVRENPHNPFSRILDVSAAAGSTITVRHDMGTTPPQPPGEVLVLGLAAGESHALTVLVDGEEAAVVEVQLDPLPEGWRQCSVEGEQRTQEIVCTNGLGAEGPNYFCADRSGTPVWSLTHPDGDIMLTVRSLPDGGFAAVGYSRSMLAIFDAQGALVDELTPLDLVGETRFEHGWIDMHEVIAITEGAWQGAVAILTVTGDEIEGRQVIASGVVVVDPGTMEVLWDWSAHGTLGDGVPIDPSMDYSRTGLLDDAEDWQHANALLHRVRDDGGEEVLLSLRGQDWIVAVDVETDTVRWRLGREGDFSGDAAAWFYQQHAPELRVVDGRVRMLVFDNGSARLDADAASRVIELELNEDTMAVELLHEVDGFFSPFYGDADLLPGGDRLQYVVGLSTEPRIAEVSWPDGEALWTMTCPDVQLLYRVSFFPSIYERAWWYDIDR